MALEDNRVNAINDDLKRKVFLRRLGAQSVQAEVGELLDASGLGDRLQGVSQVFLKPNIVSDVPEYIAAGCNTDPRVIEGLLAYLADFSLKAIIGESEVGTRLKGRRLEKALEYMGIYDLQKRYDFEIVNLTQAPQIDVEIPGALALKSVKLSTPLLDSDLIINLPKLKTHKYAVITCSLKNMFGAIPDPMRTRYHYALARVLADINSLFNEKMFIALDAIVAMEGQGPTYGTPVQMNLLLAAHRPAAADVVAAKLMGFEPTGVPHLKHFLQSFSDVGEDDIEVVGAQVADLARDFKPATRNLYVKFESWMCRHPMIIKVIFSDTFRRYVARPLHPLLSRLRGGSFTWYDDK